MFSPMARRRGGSTHPTKEFMETAFLAYLRGRCRVLPQIAVGIGDDAAVLDTPAGPKQIVCTDQIVDGVDFDAATQSLADIGFKAVAINLSDIAAMGGRPTAALVTLTLPRDTATETAEGVYEGILEAATAEQLAIAGGDITTHDGPLAISVTLLGVAERPWLRGGGQVDDAVFVTGSLGGSLAGRHLRPTSRIAAAARLSDVTEVHAAIDVSDGFSLDLDRLCAASRLGVELDIDSLPIHPDAVEMSQTSGRTPIQHAWSDGEDFELIFTVAADQTERITAESIGCPVMRVGTLVSRTGLWRREGSRFIRVFPQGYVHTEQSEATTA